MKRKNFNTGWIYLNSGMNALEGISVGRKVGEEVEIPHDASISMERKAGESGANAYFPENTCQYFKSFFLPEDACEKEIWIEFEGIYHNAYVYVNHAYVGHQIYGYGNFYLNLTKYLEFGKENEILVVIRNGVSSGRWYTGSGIYRDVTLLTADRLHLKANGVMITALDIEKKYAKLSVKSKLIYHEVREQNAVLHTQILDEIVSEDKVPFDFFDQGDHEIQQILYVETPNLWSTNSPYLYHYQVTIEQDGKIVDEETGNFGIRKLQLDPKHGLRINGKTVKLRGGCIHHDNGIIGAEDYAFSAERRIKKLKDAGYNAIRSAHHSVSRTLLNACDKYGMFVMDEFSDVWVRSKTDFDYSMHIEENWEKDLINLVEKDYNHPSVIMYSIGNEIPEIGNRFDAEWGKLFVDKIRSLDSSRYVLNCVNLMLSVLDYIPEFLLELEKTEPELAKEMKAEMQKQEESRGGRDINYLMSKMKWLMNRLASSELADRITEKGFSQVDIAGYNYAAHCYEKDYQKYPNRIIVGSETYPGDLDVNWSLVEKYANVLGDFSWAAWDYLGETGIGAFSYDNREKDTGVYGMYPWRYAYCGDFNVIGDRRPVSFWREIIWGIRKQPYIAVKNPFQYGEIPVCTAWGFTDAIHSWNWKGAEGKNIEVEVYSDAEEIELLINGNSYGKKVVGSEKTGIVKFDVFYEPGSIQAIAYKRGKAVGSDHIETAGEKLNIKTGLQYGAANIPGKRIVYIDISLVDEKGYLNMEAKEKIYIQTLGAVRMLGFGSAEPKSEERFEEKFATSFEGRLLAVVQVEEENKENAVILHSKNCKAVLLPLYEL